MSTAEHILEALDGLPVWGKWISTIFIAMLPIIELRGALPASRAVFGIPIFLAYTLSVIGNMIPIPMLLVFFPRIEKWLRKFKAFDLFFNWLFKRTRRKGENKIKLWGEMGLILFVAIPLPVTGAWTGSLLAFILDLNRKKSFLAIFLGVLIAGAIMLVWTEVNWIMSVIIIVLLIIVLIMLERIEERLIAKRENDSIDKTSR